LVKEIREEQFDPKICFFFAGDFMSEQIKSNQVIMNWAMNYVTINMKKLFDLDTQAEKMDMIHTHMKAIIGTSSTIDGYLNYFPFDS
jgi:hypothetical protein